MTTGYTDGVMDECRKDERLKEEVGRKGGLELVKTREILEKFSHLKHKNLAGAYPDVNTWDLLPALTILLFLFSVESSLEAQLGATLYLWKTGFNLMYLYVP